MAGFTQYNADAIHSAVASLRAANHDFQEHAKSVTASYMLLDDTSGGDGVAAGIEFNKEMTATRNDVSETTELICNAITESHDEMGEADAMAALAMGSH